MEEVPKSLYDPAVAKLTDGLLKLFLPHLKSAKVQLTQLNKKQESICQELHEENLKLSAAQYDHILVDMFTKIKIYREKLILIKSKMTALRERSLKLKKKVFKLEERKQREAKWRAHQREKEEQLIGNLPSTSQDIL